TATAASGGTPPYSYQWQRSPRDAGTWSNLSGQTSLTLRDRTVTPGTQYDYRLLVTDDEEETAASNVIQPDVPAAYVSWGGLGDSNSDEDRGSGGRGAGTGGEGGRHNRTERHLSRPIVETSIWARGAVTENRAARDTRRCGRAAAPS